MSTLRKIATFQVSRLMTEVKVYRDAANNEYICRAFLNGVENVAASYYTSDKADALATARSIAGYPTDADIEKNMQGEFGWLRARNLSEELSARIVRIFDAMPASETDYKAAETKPVAHVFPVSGNVTYEVKTVEDFADLHLSFYTLSCLARATSYVYPHKALPAAIESGLYEGKLTLDRLGNFVSFL